MVVDSLEWKQVTVLRVWPFLFQTTRNQKTRETNWRLTCLREPETKRKGWGWGTGLYREPRPLCPIVFSNSRLSSTSQIIPTVSVVICLCHVTREKILSTSCTCLTSSILTRFLTDLSTDHPSESVFIPKRYLCKIWFPRHISLSFFTHGGPYNLYSLSFTLTSHCVVQMSRCTSPFGKEDEPWSFTSRSSEWSVQDPGRDPPRYGWYKCAVLTTLHPNFTPSSPSKNGGVGSKSESRLPSHLEEHSNVGNKSRIEDKVLHDVTKSISPNKTQGSNQSDPVKNMVRS